MPRRLRSVIPIFCLCSAAQFTTSSTNHIFLGWIKLPRLLRYWSFEPVICTLQRIVSDELTDVRGLRSRRYVPRIAWVPAESGVAAASRTPANNGFAVAPTSAALLVSVRHGAVTLEGSWGDCDVSAEGVIVPESTPPFAEIGRDRARPSAESDGDGVLTGCTLRMGSLQTGMQKLHHHAGR